MSEAGTRELVAFYRQFLGPGDLCYDIGANVGDKAAVMLEAGATVLCVEPQGACAETLRRRFAGVAGVTVLQAAAGEEPGTAEIQVCAAAPTISTMSQRWTTGRFSSYTWDSVESVQVITLDSLIRDYGLPSYCKIDVEGYERQVLAGLSATPRVVSFEFTEEFFDDAVACVERLTAVGMTGFNLALRESPRLELEGWVPPLDLLRETRARFCGDCWGDIYATLG